MQRTTAYNSDSFRIVEVAFIFDLLFLLAVLFLCGSSLIESFRVTVCKVHVRV